MSAKNQQDRKKKKGIKIILVLEIPLSTFLPLPEFNKNPVRSPRCWIPLEPQGRSVVCPVWSCAAQLQSQALLNPILGKKSVFPATARCSSPGEGRAWHVPLHHHTDTLAGVTTEGQTEHHATSPPTKPICRGTNSPFFFYYFFFFQKLSNEEQMKQETQKLLFLTQQL